MSKIYPGTPVKWRVNALNKNDDRSAMTDMKKNEIWYYGRVLRYIETKKGKRSKSFNTEEIEVSTPFGLIVRDLHVGFHEIDNEMDMSLLQLFETEARNSRLTGDHIYGGQFNRHVLHYYLPLGYDKLLTFMIHGVKFKVINPVRKNQTKIDSYHHCKIAGFKPNYDHIKIYIAYDSYSGRGFPLKQESDITNERNLVPMLYNFDDLVNHIDYRGFNGFGKIIPIIELAKLAYPKAGITGLNSRIEIGSVQIIVHAPDGRQFCIERENWLMSNAGMIFENHSKAVELLYKLYFAVGLTESQYVHIEDDSVIKNENIYDRRKKNELNRIDSWDINTVAPFIGSKLQNLELEQCARALVSHLASANKSFYDIFTLADMGNITYEQLKPLVDVECVNIIVKTDGIPSRFMVTRKFIDIVSAFKKPDQVTV